MLVKNASAFGDCRLNYQSGHFQAKMAVQVWFATIATHEESLI